MSEAASTSTPSPQPASPESPTFTDASEDGSRSVTTPPQPAQDDPEWEFEVAPGKKEKLKRSQVEKQYRDFVRAKEIEKGAHQRFQEAAQQRKQIDAILGALDQQTEDVLAARGIDPVKFAEKVLAKRLQQEMMTPEQRRIAELEARSEQDRKAREQYEQQIQSQQEAQAVAQAQQQYDQAFAQAMTAAGLPKKPESVAWMAQRYEAYLREGHQPSYQLIEHVAKETKERFHASARSVLEDFKTEQELVDFLGPKNADRVRKYFLQQVQNKPQTQTQTAKGPTMPKKLSRKGYLTRAELNQLLDSRIK